MKPALIVLALFGVIFIGFLFASRSNEEQPAPDPATYRPPGLVAIAGTVLGRWSPRVKFPQTAYTVAGESVVVNVPASDASDEKLRRATIRVAPPNCKSVIITYESTDGEDASLHIDDPQKWQGSESEPCVGSFVVLPKGGRMTIACAALQTCGITLE